MKTFQELVGSLEEALDASQRVKAAQNFRKNKAKIALGKKRAENRKASPEKLQKRAQAKARKEMEKKILKGKSKNELSFAQRQSLEKQLDKKKAAIARLAKKLLPAVKKAEMEKGKSGSDE